jgi:hypothetical protein
VTLTSSVATTLSKAGMPQPTPPPAAAIRPRTAVNRSRTRSRANVRTQELSQRRCFAHPEDYAYIGQVNRILVKDVHPKTRQEEAIAWLEPRCGGHLLQAIQFHYRTESDLGREEAGGEPIIWHITVEFQNAELAVNCFESARGEKLHGEHVDLYWCDESGLLQIILH